MVLPRFIAAARAGLGMGAYAAAKSAVLRLTEGHCDLLLAYDHPSQPLQLAPDRYEMLTLGQETLAPFARADNVFDRDYQVAADFSTGGATLFAGLRWRP